MLTTICKTLITFIFLRLWTIPNGKDTLADIWPKCSGPRADIQSEWCAWSGPHVCLWFWTTPGPELSQDSTRSYGSHLAPCLCHIWPSCFFCNLAQRIDFHKRTKANFLPFSTSGRPYVFSMWPKFGLPCHTLAKGPRQQV